MVNDLSDKKFNRKSVDKKVNGKTKIIKEHVRCNWKDNSKKKMSEASTLKWGLFNLLKFWIMNKISISNGKVKICHKNTCVDVNGDVAKFLTFTFAAVVVVAGISSFLNSSN